MKKRNWTIYSAILFAFSGAGIMTSAEATEPEVYCEYCGAAITDGFCNNNGESGIYLQEAVLSTDIDNMSNPSYEIENAGQLAWFVKHLVSNDGVLTTANAHLSDNIDWSGMDAAGVEWQELGGYAADGIAEQFYNGFFNGNGFTISGITLTEDESGHLDSVFGIIGTTGEIREIQFDKITVEAKTQTAIGLVATKNKGTIRDCFVTESTVTTNTDYAAVSEFAAVNGDTGKIEDCCGMLSVSTGVKDDGASFSVIYAPICGVNEQSDPSAISNCWYYEDEAITPLPQNVSKFALALEGLKAADGMKFADGSLAYALNDKRVPAVYGQALDGTEKTPQLIKSFGWNDDGTAKLEGKPVHYILLDYTAMEIADSELYVNEWLNYEDLVAKTSTDWQYLSDDGVTQIPVTSAMEVKGDMVLTEVPKVTHELGAYTYNNDATCLADGTETAYCICGTECGLTDTRPAAGTMLTHVYETYTYNNDATCQADGTETAGCKYGCGTTDTRAVEGSKLTHVYESYVSDNNATCQADGTETASCKYGCGTTDTRTAAGSKVEHVYETYVSNNDATCQADGTETAGCKYGCGKTDTRTAAGSKVEHVYETYVSNNDATCQADGTETASCKYGCGATDTRTVEGSKLAHVYESYASNNDATCQADGTETASCKYGCGTTDTRAVEGSRLAHVFENYASNNDATCQADGTETASCKYGCGTTDTRAVEGSKLTHVFENYASNNDATCQADGTETADCKYGCGTTDTRTVEGSKVEHVFETYVSNNDATCQADGTETASCKYGCGATDTRTVEGSKVEHVFETYVSNNDATCQADGTETASCKYGCGTTDTRSIEDSKLSHTFEKGICKDCGAKDENYIPEDITAGLEVMNLGSNGIYVGAVTLKAPAGYTITKTAEEEAGTSQTLMVELVDGKNTITYYLRKPDGRAAERTITVDADMSAPVIVGSQKNGIYCLSAVLTITDLNTVTVTVDGTAASLNGTQLILTTAGEHNVRAVDLAGNQTEATITVVGNHNWDTGVVTEKSTCTKQGSKTFTCLNCSETKQEPLPLENHVYTNYVYDNNATCQKDGTKTATCDLGCGTKNTVTAEGSMVTHTYTNYVFDNNATCQKNGTKTAACDFGCGTTHSMEAENTVTTHKYSPQMYVYNNDATCQADGTKTAPCDFGCGTTNTIVADGTKLPHVFDTNGICSVCKETAPAPNNLPILGIEDFSGTWGVILIAVGGVILVGAAIVLIIMKKRG